MKFKHTELQRAWLDDLKKTRAKQGDTFLHSENGWCCLGRLCHVGRIKQAEKEFDASEYVNYFPFDGMVRSLDSTMRERVQLRDSIGTARKVFYIDDHRFLTLTDANDGGRTFKQIAAAIEADPENFFTNNDKV